MSDSERQLIYNISQHRAVKRDPKGIVIHKNALTSVVDNPTKSTSVSIICLDELPEHNPNTRERTGRINKSGDHLYRLLKSEKEKDYLESLKRSGVTATDAPPASANPNLNTNNFQILNGQLTDTTAPIGLLNKSANSNQLGALPTENVTIASLLVKDKARVLMERMRTNHTELNRLDYKKDTDKPTMQPQRVKDDDAQAKRTGAGRSKSMSSSSINRLGLQRPHFKMSWQAGGAQKLKKPQVLATTETNIADHNRQWDSMAKVLMSNVSSTDASDKNPDENGESVDDNLIWYQSRNLAQLKNCVSSLLFERNEFGMLEINPLAMSKIKAMKTQQNDQNNFPKSSMSMSCGHANPAACFDAAAQKIMCQKGQSSNLVNDKKPSHFFSTEIKELFGSMIHSNRRSCHSINATHIIKELHDSKAYERIKNAYNFDWARFVPYFSEKCNSKYGRPMCLAPPDLFVNSFPTTPNTFEIGQKLEAIDPHNSGLFCVATITEKCGYRIKLQFDGYSSAYGFWVNANSIDIFPAGFCSKTGRELEYPGATNSTRPNNTFKWEEYLKSTKSSVAHRACFSHLSTARTNMNPFKIGFKLEADDRKGTQKICVATIGDVIDSRVLISFDGFDEANNYWTDITSPYIHATNWHQDNGFSITTPPNWRNAAFNWENYLRVNRAEAIPKDVFHTRNPKPFEVGMALEVVDRKNPTLIRPAVIIEIYEYDIKVLYIGWPDEYAYWIPDDSTDIYPPGWCKRTNHPIEFPIDSIYPITGGSCGIRGCLGLGNGKRLVSNAHTTTEECPYQLDNWKVENHSMLPTRIERKRLVNNWFNTGAGPCRTRLTVNPSLEKTHVSLQPFLNPVELVSMSSKDVDVFRRLQVSAQFLLEHRGKLSKLREQWIDRIQPLSHVQVSASLKNPLQWSKEEVAAFVGKMKNGSLLEDVFLEHEIDGLGFLSLRQSDITDRMGIGLGSAIKIFNCIVALREECNANYIVYDTE